MVWRRTPLAWFNLTYERRRLLTAIAGVGFAVVLMFMFRGFENALYDSQVQLLKRLNGNIVIVNRIKYNMFVPQQFARRRLYQAEAFDGVTAAYPLYTVTANWKDPISKRTRPLRVLAFNPNDNVLPLPGIVQHRSDLLLPRTALIDEKSRPEVGPKQAGTVTELAEQQVTLVGTFSLGTDFASGNGNVVMSDQNFLRYFANLGPDEESRSLNTVDIGLLHVADGTNVEQLTKVLRDRLPKDISVYTKQEFVDQELNYWRKNTSIGFVFSLLTTMSFLVGVILVYQILYTDVADHWVEYATLKAIGYSNRYLFGVVLQQATLLGFLGFVPGCLISFGLYTLTRNATGLYMVMTPSRILNLMIATFLMCLISGVIAVRRVQQADPAEVFGS
ncbi:ABC transporter permease DevC [Leptolyngbya sp. FACHB-711]|uniref:ABC transporter permease DevC n=1 Tax=unclassified Leptolyngbya TaxID=2650499 RepID=UPI001687C90D|nr:ABC transporter permease DevC [Leptolyngbya sp. FACHB-711]MBD1849857.1 FtsX-like permease family protein [Cyanobacteria bacterium FACHB-502]MBD2023143.1 FtsX-like permease family protein [Leptolyngbya sp. FACHB-711]